MSRIGLVIAVEIDAFFSQYGEPKETIYSGPYEVFIFTVGNHDLYVMQSGVGEIAAAAITQLLISKFEVDAIFNFGIVGGLSDQMHIETACIVKDVVHYDFDTSCVDNCEVGRYLELPDIYIPMSQKFLDQVKEIAPELKQVRCASGDKFILENETRNKLHNTFLADICDMEIAGIALTCYRNKIPAMSIKVVSDALDSDAKDYWDNYKKVALQSAKIFDQIIQRFS